MPVYVITAIAEQNREFSCETSALSNEEKKKASKRGYCTRQTLFPNISSVTVTYRNRFKSLN